MEYVTFYIEANLVCIFIFAILLYHSVSGVDKQMKRAIFSNVLVSNIVYYISDIFWIMILKDVILKNRFSVSLVNFINAIMLMLIAYNWFLYVEVSQNNKKYDSDKTRLLSGIPVLINTAVLIIGFISPLMLDEHHNLTTFYYLSFLIVPISYVLVATYNSLRRSFKKENYANKSHYILCALYPMMIVVFGLIQTLSIELPLFCFGTTITMVYVYITSLDSLVSLDPLTGLNNRNQLRKFVQINSLRKNIEHYILMIDLNKFKSINDTYGHIEGDKAIVNSANIIRNSCIDDSNRPFISRYGGDEFVIIVNTNSEQEVIRLIDKIKTNFNKYNNESNLPYQINADIGYSKYGDDFNDFEKALKQADNYLYEYKKSHRQ